MRSTLSRSSLVRSALLAAALVCVAAPAAADGALYKWVDQRGVVNYGDKPPPGAKHVTQIDESKTNVSVVPGLDKETLDDMNERAMRARIERLERELQELRERESHKAAAPVHAEDPRVAAAGYFAQPLVVVRKLPPHSVHFPAHGRPVQKAPPTPGMRLERP